MDGLTCILQQSPLSSHFDSTLFSPFGDRAHVAMIPNGFNILWSQVIVKVSKH